MPPSGSVLTPDAMEAAKLIREHPQSEVLPDLLMRKIGVERWQAISLLKELADAGYGNFILGRKGGKTRLEKAEFLPKLSLPSAPNEQNNAPENIGDCQIFLLRRTPPIHIKVPADITLDEAEKLGKWLTLIAQ